MQSSFRVGDRQGAPPSRPTHGTIVATRSPRQQLSSGIGIALWGGPGWEAADDWASLVAAVVIALNGLRLLRPAIQDLMDVPLSRRQGERGMMEALAS